MYEFGEELLIESYKVPWLIWIQLLVTVLLLLLLFFGLFTLDLSDNSASTSSAGGRLSSSGRTNALLAVAKCPLPSTSSSHRTDQGGDEIVGVVETSTSRGGGIIRGEERDGSSSVKDARLFGHPCHFLGAAKQAFLKCLGLDSTSDRPNSRKHGKED